MLAALYAEDSAASTEEDSHLHVARDEETGEPIKARFTYVDEHSCIGCTYCTQVARSTFFLEEDHGRARVYDQEGDDDELVQEAIDACPVNCIHYVSFEDLVVLEHERAGQFINNKARLVSQQEARSDAPPTKASFFDEGGIRCNNCPSRGCKECPMFGVGRNPVYRERLEARNARREASGAAAAEAEDARRAEMIENLFDVEGASPEELRGASGAAAMAGGTALADAHAQRGEDAMAADWRGELGADVGAWSGDEDGGDDERLAAPEAAASTAAAFDVLFAEPAPFLLDDIGEDE